MVNHPRIGSLRLVKLLMVLTPAAAFAAPADHPVFGQGQPANVSELPPGMLKERLESLPPTARQSALRWLQDFSFPAADAAHMSADDAGGIYYVDEAPDGVEEAEGAAAEPPTSGALSAAETFALHSKPGASKVLFLDFDGHVIEGTAWNANSSRPDTYYARPFDTDGSPSSFGSAELETIHEVWHRVAEDFAAFDVDVTTEDPGSFGPSVGHVLVTKDDDELGNAMPSAGAGGVAYVGVFGRSNYTYYQPALVYYDNLGNGHPPYVAEASSHEFGHNLSLSHDGTSTTSYFQGLGSTSSFVSWAPIMGVGYYRQVTQWSNGEYADANNTQDDLSIITGHLGPRGDDHGDDILSASLLVTDGAGTISHSNPQSDPGNFNPENKGIIDQQGDVDVFGLQVGTGTVDITVTPAWDAFTRSMRRGANLDIQARLLDDTGTVIATSDPGDDTDASIQVQLDAGYYYLAVTGVGNSSVPYSDYASQGMYFISGQAVTGEPNGAPTANGDTAGTAEDFAVDVAVLANDSDPDGDALSILSVSSPANGTTDISGTMVIYTPNANFAGNDAFTYSVGDGRGGSDSATVTVTVTGMNDAPSAVNDAAATASDTPISVAVLSNDTDVDGDALSVVGVGAAGNGTVSHDGSAVQYTPAAGFSGTDTFGYTVSDGQATASATVTVTVSAPAPATPGSFAATDGANGTAALTWTDSANETGYEVERESLHRKRGVWVGTSLVATPGQDATSHTDASGTGNYRYRIRAVNGAGASSWTPWQEVAVTETSGSGGGGGGTKGGGNGRKK